MKKKLIFLCSVLFVFNLHAQNWLTTGNAGLTTSNFVGTTDNVNLIFKRNNLKAGLLSANSASFGVNAMNTGQFNGAFGVLALQKNTTGAGNVALGYQSFQNNTTGNGNTAAGYRSAYLNSTGSGICAFGDSAAYYTTSDYTTAFGYAALSKNTTGTFNNAFGPLALYSNSTGQYNMAAGYQALYSNTTANNNTAIGYQALKENINGYSNTSLGYQALVANTSGHNNVAIGLQALFENTTGFFNVAVGNFALLYNRTGTENTAIGHGANVASVSIVYSNATAIGSGATVDASNKVRIGNTSVNSIGGQVGWTTFSDGRYKKNIKEDVKGLLFINSLKPITYTVDIDGLNAFYNKDRRHDEAYEDYEAMKKNMQPAADEASKIVYNGFVAQDVEAAAKKINYDFSGVDKPKAKDGLYGLRYSDFVVPLVKAVQELSKMNDSKDSSINQLKTTNAEQKKINIDLQTQINELKTLITGTAPQTTNNAVSAQTVELSSTPSLDQNIPNPFAGVTTINCNVPVNNGDAYLNFYNQTGALLKSVKITGTGKNSITLKANELSSGTYKYALLIDGKLIDSKLMVLQK